MAQRPHRSEREEAAEAVRAQEGRRLSPGEDDWLLPSLSGVRLPRRLRYEAPQLAALLVLSSGNWLSGSLTCISSLIRLSLGERFDLQRSYNKPEVLYAPLVCALKHL